jgi:glutathione S-transferase
MIELIQFPWSPFCLVQSRILEYGKIPFRAVNIPPSDRSLVWRLTRQRYYAVPIIRDGKTVVFETDDDSQVIAKYLDEQFKLDLFPVKWSGVQHVLWRYFEHEIEAVGFKLNDIYYEEFVTAKERLPFLRHKERKFGRGCIDQWRQNQPRMFSDLALLLRPCEQMTSHSPFLLDDQPRFVDFNLYGMLANFLFSGNYEFPSACPCLKAWYERMGKAAMPKKSVAK